MTEGIKYPNCSYEPPLTHPVCLNCLACVPYDLIYLIACVPPSAFDAFSQSSSGAPRSLRVSGRYFSSQLDRLKFRRKLLVELLSRQVHFNFMPYGVQSFVPTEE